MQKRQNIKKPAKLAKPPQPRNTGPKMCISAGMEFLAEEFVSCVTKQALYHHYTCATDTENIRIVFEVVRDTLIANAIDAFKLN